MAFDWHSAVEIGPGFTPQERTLVEHSLDSIAAAHDGEGAELLRAAAHLQGQKIAILPKRSHPGFTAGGGSDASTKGVIQINFSQTAMSEVRDGGTGEARHISLTGLLVHEIFHKADPLANLPHDVVERIRDAEFDKLVAEGLVKRGNDGTLSYSSKAGDSPVDRRMAADTGLNSADGVYIWETRATQYTDAFMRKNFGTQEPMRVRYENTTSDPATEKLTLEQQVASLRLPHLNATTYQTEGYSSEISPVLKTEFGNLPPAPSIKPQAQDSTQGTPARR